MCRALSAASTLQLCHLNAPKPTHSLSFALKKMMKRAPASPLGDITGRQNNLTAQSPHAGPVKKLSYSQAAPKTPVSLDDSVTADGNDENEIVDIDPPIGLNQNATAARSSADSSACSIGMGNGINVAVRIRPFTEVELQRQEVAAVTEVSSGILRLTPPEGSQAKKISASHIEFEFGRVHNQESTQEDVYNCHARDMVQGLFQQQSSLLFVYGVSNSGKTFTISGPKSNPGVVPLALQDLFNKIEDCKDSYEVRVSYFEFYVKNEVYDLLSSSTVEEKGSSAKKAPRPVSIKGKTESTNYGKCVAGKILGNTISFPGLTEAVVSSATQALRLLEQGQARKHVESTGMNAASSRSHSVFSIKLARRSVTANAALPPLPPTLRAAVPGDDSVLATLSIVDLAGVERHKKASLGTESSDSGMFGANANSAAEQREKQRRAEAATINQSLMELGATLRSLSDRNVNKALSAAGLSTTPGGAAQMSFKRDSHFNFYVQTLLVRAGPGLITMITNISPGASDYDEKVKVLEYSSIAKRCVVVPESPAPKQTPRRSLLASRSATKQTASSRRRSSIMPSDEVTADQPAASLMTMKDFFAQVSQLDAQLQHLSSYSMQRSGSDLPDAGSMSASSSIGQLAGIQEETRVEPVRARSMRSSGSGGAMSFVRASLGVAGAGRASLLERRKSSLTDFNSMSGDHRRSSSFGTRAASPLTPSQLLCVPASTLMHSASNVSLRSIGSPGAAVTTEIEAPMSEQTMQEGMDTIDAQTAEDDQLEAELSEMMATGNSEGVLEKVFLLQCQSRARRATELIVRRMSEARRSTLATAFYRLRVHSLERERQLVQENLMALDAATESNRRVLPACERLWDLMVRTQMRDRKAAALTKWRQFVSVERELEYEERATVAMNKLQETIGQLRKLESSMQALRAQHLDSESALATNEQALKECIAQYQQASQALSEAEVQRDSAEQQCLRAQSEIESLTEECDELNIELQETKSARQEETNAHTIVMEQLEAVIVDLKTQCAAVQQQCKQLQEERDQLDTELGRVRTMVSTQEEQLQSLMAAHSLNMKEIDVKHAEVLSAEAEKLSAAISSCESMQAAHQQLTANAAAAAAHFEQQASEFRQQLEAAHQEGRSLCEVIEKLQHQQIELTESKNQAAQLALTAMKAQESAFQAQMQSAQQCHDAAASEFKAELRSAAKRALAAMFQLRQVRDEGQQQSNQFKARESDLLSTISDANAERAALSERYDELQQREEATIAKLHTVTDELETLRVDAAQARANAEQTMQQLQQELETVQQALQQQTAAFDGERSEAQTQQSELNAQCADLQSKLAATEQEVCNLKQKEAALESQIQQLNEQLHSAQQAHSALQNQLESLVASTADELSETRAAHSKAMQEIEARCTQLINAHAAIEQAASFDAKKANEDMQQLMADHATEIQNAALAQQNLQQQHASNQQELISAHDAQIARLTAAMQAAASEYNVSLQESKALCQQLEQQVAAAEQRIIEADEKRVRVEAELQAQVQSLQQVMQLSKAKEAETEALLAIKERELAVTITEQRQQLLTLQSVQRALEREQSSSVDARKVATEAAQRSAAELAQSENAAQALRQQRDELHAAVAQLESSLEKAHAEFGQQTNQLRAEFANTLTEKQQEAEAESQHLRSIADATQQTLNEQLSALRQAHTTLQCELERQITALTWSEEKHSREAGELQEQLDQERARAQHDRESSAAEMTAERNMLNKDLFHARETEGAVRAELSTVRAHYQAAVDKMQADSLAAQHKLLETRCAMMDRLFASSRTCRQLRQDVSTLREQVDAERFQWVSQTTALEKRAAELEKSVAERESQIQEASQRMRSFQAETVQQSARKDRDELKLTRDCQMWRGRAEDLQEQVHSAEAHAAEQMELLSQVRQQQEQQAKAHGEQIATLQQAVQDVHAQLQAAEAQAAKDVSERRHLMAARDSEFRARAALEVECQALRADLAQVRMETSSAIVSAMLQRRSADARAAAALATLQHTCDAALHDSEQQQVRHAAEVAQLTAAREGVQADAAAALAQKEADLQRHVTATQSLQKRLKAAEHRLTQQKAETTRTSEEAAHVRDQLAAEIQSLTNELAELQNDRCQSAEEWRMELERRDQQLSSQQSEYEQVKASLEQVRAAQEVEMNRLSAQFETAMESYRMTITEANEKQKQDHLANIDNLNSEIAALRRAQNQVQREQARLVKQQESERTSLQSSLNECTEKLACAHAERDAAAAQMAELHKQISQHLGGLFAGATGGNSKLLLKASAHSKGTRHVKFVSPIQSEAKAESSSNAATDVKSAPVASQETAALKPAIASSSTVDSMGSLTLQETLDLVRQKVQLLNSAPSIPDTMSVVWFKDVTKKPLWQADDARKDCTICQSEFGFFNRRHHCRMCGFLYCQSCSSKTMPIPHNNNQVERCCDICAVKVRFHVAQLGK